MDFRSEIFFPWHLGYEVNTDPWLFMILKMYQNRWQVALSCGTFPMATCQRFWYIFKIIINLLLLPARKQVFSFQAFSKTFSLKNWWKKFRQECKCHAKPEKLHCWVASTLWSGLAPDFSALGMCSRQRACIKNLELGRIRGYCRPKKEPLELTWYKFPRNYVFSF